MSATQLALPTCVLPGCGTPVAAWGDPCRGCTTAFGPMLRSAGERLTEADITARDAEIARGYALQRAAS